MIFRNLLLLFFSIGLIACNSNPLGGENSELGDEFDPGSSGGSGSGQAPNTPSAIALTNPASSPGNDTTPTFLVSGVTSGDTVFLFSDSSCSTSIGSSTAISGTVSITTNTLTDGTFTVFAQGVNANGVSSCSSVSATYVLDATAPDVTVEQGGAQADPGFTVPITFDIVFSEAIDTSTFTTADITNSGTATVTAFTITNSGDDTNFTITADTITENSGTVILSIAAGVVSDAVGNTNTVSTSTDNSVTFDARYYGYFQGTELSGGAPLNNAAYDTFSWTTTSDFTTQYFSHDTTTNPEQISIQLAGDYLASLTIPIETPVQAANNVARVGISAEIRINNVVVDINNAETYIRNPISTDGLPFHYESSIHMNVLLEGLSAGDVVEVYVIRNTTGTEEVTTTGAGTLYLEFVESARTIFSANATTTTAGADLDQGFASLQWTSTIVDGGFTHGAATDITLDAAGSYLTLANLPLEVQNGAARSCVGMSARLDAVAITGGTAQQGYIRNDTAHTTSSAHLAAITTSAAASSVFDLQVGTKANNANVNTPAGKAATLYMELLDTSADIFSATTTTLLTANADWNQTTATNLEWTSVNITDATVFSQPTDDVIQVLEAGDYMVYYNDALDFGGIQRGNIIVHLAVNGATISGAQCKSHYARGADGHDESSCVLAFPLFGLSANDEISVVVQSVGNSGAVAAEDSAFIMVWKK